MIDFLKAIEQRMGSLEYTTYRIRAPQVESQYVVLSGSAWDRPDEESLGDVSTSVETELRLTAVVGTTDGVLIMLDRIRSLLSPDLGWAQVPMTGWSLWLKYVRSEAVDVDTSVMITDTNQHPAYGVDTYQLMADPI